MSLVVVATYRYRHEGEFARAILDAEGIPCMITADDAGGMRPEIMSANPVKVFVDEADADAAREALSNEE